MNPREMFEKEMDEDQDNYEWSLTPQNASDDNKSGVTIKGKDTEYINANKKVASMFKKRGDKFKINGIELSISDAPKNKPVTIELKPVTGVTGKANLKIYDVNNRGGATIMITRVRNSDMNHVKTLAFKVIKYLLDGIISGCISEDRLATFKRNISKGQKKKKVNNCVVCDEVFPSEQELQEHRAHAHRVSMHFKCDKCAETFKDRNELSKHVQQVHEELSSPDAKRIRTFENKSIAPKSREIEIQVDENDLKQSNEQVEMMDIDLKETEKVDLSKRNDEKILLKQKSLEKEEEALKLIKQIKEKRVEEDEKKRKRQNSTEKKKKKKKANKEKSKNAGTKLKINGNDKTRGLDEKYKKLFKDEGLDIKDFVRYIVKGNGACGSNCTALAYHFDEKLGPYVRRNINEFTVLNWEIVKDHITFPHTQVAGSEKIKFETEKEYLEFLKNNEKSGWLWMDHLDLQSVANYYQINIHILTTNIAGMEEPAARWTHLSPDMRLKGSRNIPADLPDMWLFHVDSIHFDLIVRKDSLLAEGANITKGEKINPGTESSTEFTDETIGPGYMGWKRTEEEIPARNVIVSENKEITSKFIDETTGQGYMGQKTSAKKATEIEDNENTSKFTDENTGRGVMGLDDQRYQNLQKNYDELKKNHEILKEKQRIFGNDLEKLNKDVNSLKKDYKESIEALRKETHDRTKAEDTVKVLKNIIEAKNEINEDSEKTTNGVEDMEIDEALGEWVQRQKRKRIQLSKSRSKSNKCEKCGKVFTKEKELANHIKSHSQDIGHECEKCEKVFESRHQLKEHEALHSTEAPFLCVKCKDTFTEEKGLREHDLRIHKTNKSIVGEKCNEKFQDKITKCIQNNICETCNKTFENEKDLKEHKDLHKKENIIECEKCEEIFYSQEGLVNHAMVHLSVNSSDDVVKQMQCNKCDKVYENMAKLRRHDWRDHRQIECNICGKLLESRKDISNHRMETHKMFRKIVCRYYPNCIDQEECFFVHEDQSGFEDNRSWQEKYCSEGDKCKNQSCKYDESKHKNLKDILCKFQEKCKKFECLYKHEAKRAAFLGNCEKSCQPK